MTYAITHKYEEIKKDSEKLYQYQVEHPDVCIWSIGRYMTQKVWLKMKELAKKEPYTKLYNQFEKDYWRMHTFDEACFNGLIEEGTTYPCKTFEDYWSELYDTDVELQKYFKIY